MATAPVRNSMRMRVCLYCLEGTKFNHAESPIRVSVRVNYTIFSISSLNSIYFIQFSLDIALHETYTVTFSHSAVLENRLRIPLVTFPGPTS